MAKNEYASRGIRLLDTSGPDDFPTPPWATRALIRKLEVVAPFLSDQDKFAWEPAAGRGYMADVLRRHYREVIASDAHAYPAAYQLAICDFLNDCDVYNLVPIKQPDFIATNPPFKLAADFIKQANAHARHGFAIFARLQLLEGKARYNDIWNIIPPTFIMPFVERVPIHQGKLTATGSTATAYAWFVWDFAQPATKNRVEWIAPCRKDLEQDGDYD